MVNLNWSKAFCEFRRLFKKGLIILSLLVLSSCTMRTPKHTPVAQELGKLANGSVIEGQFTDSQYKAARKVIEQAPGEVEVYANTGIIHSVITGSTEIAGQTPEERISNYFDENADLYQIGQFSQTFEPVKQFDQVSGVQVRQYKQAVDGILVYQADIRVLLDSKGKIALVNSNYMPDSEIPSTLKPKMNSTEASRAMQALGFVLSEDENPSLVIYSPAMVGEVERSFLAWVAKAGWDGGFGDVLIKDYDGSLVLQSTNVLTESNQIMEGKSVILLPDKSSTYIRANFESLPYSLTQTKYEDSQFSYEIRDYQGMIMADEITLAEYNSKPLLASSTDENDSSKVSYLTDHLDQILSFYKERFAYSKFSVKAGSEIKVLVNIDYGTPFMTGLGDYPLLGFTLKHTGNDIDTVAHEFQHIVTTDFVMLEHDVKTPYASALDEAISDFFGAVADKSNRRWQQEINGQLLRDLQTPKNSGNPDHMNYFVQPSKLLAKWEGTDDNYGNGHTNSTIFSHALYLLSEGGQKGNINVLGIGIENVAQIVFRSLALMNNNATFQHARNAMVLTCENMVHEGNTPESYCYQLKNALAAVGIGAPGSIYPVDSPPYEGLQFGWQLSPNLNFGKTPDVYAEIADLGFSFVREVFPWNLVQQQKNDPIDLNFGSMEHEIWTQSVKDNNLQVMATLVGPPPTSDQSDEDFLTEWRHYLEMIVPELTETVDYWQIGNQMNTNSIWKSFRASAQGADPALYGKMLRIAYEVTKVNERSDLVIIGGLNNLSGQEFGGLDSLSFLKGTIQTCQPHCFDMVGLYLEWGEYLPEEERPLKWNGNQIYVNMADYLNIFVQDVASIVGTSKPIWITGMGLDGDLPSLISEKQKIDLDTAQTELLVKTIVSLSSNKAVQTVFYNDLSDALSQGAGSDIGTMVHLLSGSVPQGRYPVYSQTGEAIEEASQYRFTRESELDAAFVWSNDPTIWNISARIETIEDIQAEAQKFVDFSDPENRADVSYGGEFTFEKEIMVFLAELEDDDKLIVGEANPMQYGQLRFDHPMSPGLYLTYDTAKWRIEMDYYLASKEYPDCRVADYGPLDSSPGEGDKYRYEEFTEFVGGIEYLFEKWISNETGISDAMKIYFDKNGNYWKYAFRLGFSPEIYDECLAVFWEVMELSRANNFSEVPGLAP